MQSKYPGEARSSATVAYRAFCLHPVTPPPEADSLVRHEPQIAGVVDGRQYARVPFEAREAIASGWEVACGRAWACAGSDILDGGVTAA